MIFPNLNLLASDHFQTFPEPSKWIQNNWTRLVLARLLALWSQSWPCHQLLHTKFGQDESCLELKERIYFKIFKKLLNNGHFPSACLFFNPLRHPRAILFSNCMSIEPSSFIASRIDFIFQFCLFSLNFGFLDLNFGGKI